MSDSFRDKLRRQRRDAPAGRVTQLRQRAREQVERELGARSARVARSRGLASGDPCDLESFENSKGRGYARVLEYPLEHRHGCHALSDALRTPRVEWDVLGRDAALQGLDLREAVFLDTETTGLRGGAGTQVFLIGIGRFVGTRFVLWQGFLSDPSEEPALLEACEQRLEGCRGLVSFFGKSFDRHRLHERFAFHRRRSPFLELPHLDLYWLCRRLRLGDAENGRLCTMERLLAGVERAEDLPGSEAPAAWFAHQRGQPHLLEAVFEHHRDDVLSLVSLAAGFASLLEGGAHEAEAALFAARSCAQAGSVGVESFWIRAREKSTESLRPQVALEFGVWLRKQGRAAEALSVLEDLRSGPADAVWFEGALERLGLLRRLKRESASAMRELRLARSRLAECSLQWMRERWSERLEQEAKRWGRRAKASEREAAP